MRGGWSPKLRDLIQRADPGAYVIAEVVKAGVGDTKDLRSEWQGANSTAGFTFPNSGGVTLTPSSTTLISQPTDDGATETGLTRDTPFAALVVRWTANDAESLEIRNFVARLHPKINGLNPKEVTEWRCGVYRVIQVGEEDDRIVVAPIGEARATATGEAVSDVTFTFPTAPATPVVGPPPEDLTKDGGTETYPLTLFKVWGVKDDGTPAGNTAWMCDSAQGFQISGTGYIAWHWAGVDDADGAGTAGNEVGGTAWSLLTAGTNALRFTINRQGYTAGTIEFSQAGNRIDLGSTPTGDLEIVVRGREPSDSTASFEVWDGTSAWVPVLDGDYIGKDNTDRGGSDLTSLSVAQTYDIRVVLTPSTDGFRAPTAFEFGMREITRTDLAGVATVSDYRVQVEPVSLKGNIPRATVRVLKTGERDYMDYGSEILATNHIGDMIVRVWVGDPTYEQLARHEWLHVDSFEIEDYTDADTAHVLHCLSPVRRLGVKIPPFVVTGGNDGDRTAEEYANATVAAAYDDIVDNLVALPARYRGPGLIGTNTVSKIIYDSDGKDELDRLAYLEGWSVISSQGRVKAVPMMRDEPGGENPLAVFYIGDYTPVSIGPGYRARVDEFFVPYGWSETTESFYGEARQFNATAFVKLGGSGLDTSERLDDETGKWIDTLTHAKAVAARIPQHFGNGLIQWEIRSTYPHPYLEPGDPVVIVTDRFVGRSPIDNREIRGPVAAHGIITMVGDVLGKTFAVWIPGFDDIRPTDGAVTWVNYYEPTPVVLNAAADWSANDGSVDVRVMCEVPDSVSIKAAISTSTYPTAATVRGESAVALDGNGAGTVSFTGPYGVGQIVFVSIFAYSGASGSGNESPLFTVPFVRNKHPLAVGFTLDMHVVEDGGALKWEYVFNYKVSDSPLVQSLHLGVFTYGQNYNLPTPGADGSVTFTTKGLLSWSNYVIVCTGYDATGGDTGGGNAGPTAKDWVGAVGKRGNLGVKAADGESPSTETVSDRLIFNKGLTMVADATGRAQGQLKYTLSQSDPSGVPEDGELWFKY